MSLINIKRSLLQSTDEESQQNDDQGINTNEVEQNKRKEGQQEIDEGQEPDQETIRNDQDKGSDPSDGVEPVYASVLPKNLRPKKQQVKT